MTKRTLVQFFHWYYPDGGRLWNDVGERAEEMAGMGVTDVWLPPAYKGSAGGQSIGYDVYDLFDLGESIRRGLVPLNMATGASWRMRRNRLNRRD